MSNMLHDSTAQSTGPSDVAPSRRRFLDYLLGTSAVATLGAIVYPIIRFMSPPHIIESTESSVVAAKINEIPVNSGKIFKFGSKPGILVRTDSGELKAGIEKLGQALYTRQIARKVGCPDIAAGLACGRSESGWPPVT